MCGLLFIRIHFNSFRLYTDAYPELLKTSMMDCFAAIVKGLLPISGKATESTLNLMKNAFYFILALKALFFLRYIDFCRDFFGHVGKHLNKKVKGIFKIYDFINWEINNFKTHSAQYLKKQTQ